MTTLFLNYNKSFSLWHWKGLVGGMLLIKKWNIHSQCNIIYGVNFKGQGFNCESFSAQKSGTLSLLNGLGNYTNL